MSIKEYIKELSYTVEKIICGLFYAKKLKNYKDAHTGKRCFIIGNGPSLKAEDLEAIKGEYSFAANSIFKIFNDTSWRPTFYMIQDAAYAAGIVKDLPKVEAEHKFISINSMIKNCFYSKDYIGFYLNRSIFPNPPEFSADISKELHEGYTILYSAMQFAVYMGFKEIYLLGVDFNYSTVKDNSGNVISTSTQSNHFFDNQGKQVIGPLPNLEYSLAAYQKAREHTESNKAKINNATRGGKLEVFERTSLEEILD